MMREPCSWPVTMKQPVALSLQATSLPVQLAKRIDRTVLMRVPAPHVSMVANPDTFGDH